MDFTQSISLAMAKTMQHLSDFVFNSMANITLTRRDFYLNHLRSAIKQDTLKTLRTAPLHLATLFPDTVLKKAEEDIAQFENKGYSGLSSQKKGCYYLYERPSKSSNEISQSYRPAWKSMSHGNSKKGRDKSSHYTSQGSVVFIDDNYWVAPVYVTQLTRAKIL